MLSFTIAHLSVIRLRQPHTRTRSASGNRLGNVRAFGFDLPLTAVFGGFGTFAAWIVVMALNPRTLVIGAIWMAARYLDLPALPAHGSGLSPSQTHKVLLPEPLGVEEVEYKSVLVAFEDDEPFSEQTMVTAVKLAVQAPPRDPRDRHRHRAQSPAARRPARASRRRTRSRRSSRPS